MDDRIIELSSCTKKSLCIEIIEFKHLKNNDIDFNSNGMYNLAEIRGNKKKVNFEVLPRIVL